MLEFYPLYFESYWVSHLAMHLAMRKYMLKCRGIFVYTRSVNPKKYMFNVSIVKTNKAMDCIICFTVMFTYLNVILADRKWLFGDKNNYFFFIITFHIKLGKKIEHVNVWFVLSMVDCKQCAHMDTERHQVHPVDCQKYLPFWISWTNNVIKVGKGIDVGKQTFLTWNDTVPHAVNYVAFATGWGATGKWKVTRGIYNIKLC